MLSPDKSRALKAITNRPPLMAQMPPSLQQGYVLTPAERGAPLPMVTTHSLVAALKAALEAMKNQGSVSTVASVESDMLPIEATTTPSVPIEDIKAFITEDSLKVSDSEMLAKLSGSKLSPSLVMALYGCHARMVVQRYSADFGIETDSPEMVRGSAFHAVFEKLMRLEPSERTVEAALELLPTVLDHEKYDLIRDDEEQVDWLKSTIEKGFSFRRIGEPIETPADVKLADVPGDRSPLEYPISGRIGEASRETFGIIDRVAVGSDGMPVIQDYKTGSKMKAYEIELKKRTGDLKGQVVARLPERSVTEDGTVSWNLPPGFAEAFQQYSYMILGQQNGLGVERAELLYPAVESATNVASVPPLVTSDDVSPVATEFDSWVRNAYGVADKALDELSESGEFTYSPSFLCSWCPLAKMCPKFQPLGGKGVAARESQPDSIPYISM